MEFDEEENKLKVNVEHTSEAADVHTARVLEDVANLITKMLVWEEDCPSNHKDKGMPVLDLKVTTQSSSQGGGLESNINSSRKVWQGRKSYQVEPHCQPFQSSIY